MGRSWTIEMFWRCPHCKTLLPGMTGEERESLRCVPCGYDKKDSDPWIMPENPEQQEHLKGELHRRASAGENWACKFCGAESRATHDKCEVCGAPRDTIKSAHSSSNPSPLASVHSGPSRRDATPPPPPPKHVNVTVPSNSRQPSFHEKPLPVRSSFWERFASFINLYQIWIVSVILGLGIAVLIGWLVTPREANVRITDMHWTRSEILQERHDYSGIGWQDQEPSDVFQQTCEPRQRGTHNCNPHDCNCHQVGHDCNCTGGNSYSCNCHEVCHTSCRSNRNGSASCSESCSESCGTCYTPRRCSTCYREECDTCYQQCPTIVNWCHYQFHQWDTMGNHGLDRHDNAPEWPQPPFVAASSLQRVQRSESYHILFTQDDDRTQYWDRTYDSSQFTQFRMRQHWHIQYSHAGSFTLLRTIP